MSNYHTIGQRLDILIPAIIARGPVTALSLSQMILGLHSGREDSIELRREVDAWLIRNHHLVYWSHADEGYRLRHGVVVDAKAMQHLLMPLKAHCALSVDDLRQAVIDGAKSIPQIATRLNQSPTQVQRVLRAAGCPHFRTWVRAVQGAA